MTLTPLQQLLERLKSLEDNEYTLNGKVAYMLSIAAAESLLEDEQRFIQNIKNNDYKKCTSL